MTGASRRNGRVFSAVALAGFVTASVSLVGPTVAPSPAQAAPVVSAPTTTYAIVRQITGMNTPRGIGIDSADDTVYVGSGNTSQLYVINGKTGALVDTLPFEAPYNAGQINGVAVNDVDDTVYANINTGGVGVGGDGLALLSGRNPRDDSSIVSVVTGMGGIAVDALDNRVVTADGSNPSNVYRFNGSDGSTAGSAVSMGRAGVQSVAINVSDDTVYASGVYAPWKVSVIDGRTWTLVGEIPKGIGSGGLEDIAVNQADDTVYVLNYNDRTMSVIDGRTGMLTDDTVAVGPNPMGVAVDQRDDTVYVVNDGRGAAADSLSVIDGRSATLTDDTITIDYGASPYDVAVDDAGSNGGLVYVSLQGSSAVAVIGRVTPSIWPPAAPVGNTLTLTLDVPQAAYDVDNATVTTVYFDDTAVTPTAGAGDTWTMAVPPGSGTVPITVKLRGGLYASAGSFTFGTTVPTAPTLDTATGGLASIDIAWTEIFDGGSPITKVWYALDDYTQIDLGTLTSPATITADKFGNPLAPGETYVVRIRVQTAVGTSNWSNTRTATTNSSPTPPTPPVTYPPGPPTDVVAVAGDGSATVSWSAPADSGSFSITDYEVKASPGGASCLVKVPDTKCTVSGLSNGTAYTFEVRALNGAGWGPWSTASDPVTPVGPQQTPTIVITGSRGVGADAGRVFADGVTTHLVGRQVQARVHLSGQVNYENGSVRTVASNGTFRWQRQTKKTVYVYFRVVDELGVRSNRLVIRLDRP